MTSGLFIMKVWVTGSTMWSRMPSSRVLSTATSPSLGPLKMPGRMGMADREPAMMPTESAPELARLIGDAGADHDDAEEDEQKARHCLPVVARVAFRIAGRHRPGHSGEARVLLRRNGCLDPPGDEIIERVRGNAEKRVEPDDQGSADVRLSRERIGEVQPCTQPNAEPAGRMCCTTPGPTP